MTRLGMPALLVTAIFLTFVMSLYEHMITCIRMMAMNWWSCCGVGNHD